jgi:hypothetical protein
MLELDLESDGEEEPSLASRSRTADIDFGFDESVDAESGVWD